MFRNFFCTAAAVFFLLSSHGQVQYYQVDSEEVVVSTYDNTTQEISEYFIWDFDSDGSNDFFLEAISFFDHPIQECTVSETYRFFPFSGDFLVGESNFWNCADVHPFVRVSNLGDTIRQADFDSTEVQYVFAKDEIFEVPILPTITGNGYMGFRFSQRQYYFYGWLHFEFSGSGFAHQLSVHEIAIHRTPNNPIVVGDKGANCPDFYTAPVDLTKSFNPVNGVVDRVQVKWYKDSPQIKYTDEDAAMCDIKFWPARNLDPNTGQAYGPLIQDPDTIILVNKKKLYPDGSPRSIFKWPIRFRADGANTNRRVDPNTRYKFQVRCECGHDGEGWESPWSEIKIFNTPNFDPSTGIYSGAIEQFETKSISDKLEVDIYPNPSQGEIRLSGMTSDTDVSIEIYDLSGQVVYAQESRSRGDDISIDLNGFVKPGSYVVRISTVDRENYEHLIIQ